MSILRSAGLPSKDSPEETVEELFALMESALLSYAKRLVKEDHMAEDLVQEAFVRLHRSFAEVKSPRNWLYRTVHNLALNLRRKEDRVVRMDGEKGAGADHGEESGGFEFPDPHPLPDEQIARWEGVGLVRLNLENLDARSREVIRLKFNEELSYREISARTGLSVSNVGYLLHQSMKALAADLAKAGLVP